MRSELLANRRQWESRLIGQIASRWGFSPWALVLRLYQGLGALVSTALLWRMRTPAQLALWGTVQGARTWQARRRARRADRSAARAVAGSWGPAELHAASIVLDGYAAEAGLPRETTDPDVIIAEAAEAGSEFLADVSVELQTLIARVADRHTGWFTRWRYELMLGAMLAFLLYRLGRNFFYDSWLAPRPVAPLGLDFYLSAGFWLVFWCLVLLWAFTSRLRRGLRQQIDQLASGWNNPKPAARVFARLEAECGQVERFRQELSRLRQHVAGLRHRLALPEANLGRRR
jgi:hypothetical protein